MCNLLQSVVQHGTGAAILVGVQPAVRGKNRNLKRFSDAWFVGFTPDIACVVLGRHGRAPVLGYGVTGRAWEQYPCMSRR